MHIAYKYFFVILNELLICLFKIHKQKHFFFYYDYSQNSIRIPSPSTLIYNIINFFFTSDHYLSSYQQIKIGNSKEPYLRLKLKIPFLLFHACLEYQVNDVFMDFLVSACIVILVNKLFLRYSFILTPLDAIHVILLFLILALSSNTL